MMRWFYWILGLTLITPCSLYCHTYQGAQHRNTTNEGSIVTAHQDFDRKQMQTYASLSFDSAMLLAREQRQLARHDAALAWYQLARQKMVNAADTTILFADLGYQYRTTHQYDTATYYFCRALEATSDSLGKVSIVNGLGLTFLSAGAKEEAFQYFQTALNYTPSHQNEHRNSLLHNMMQALPDEENQERNTAYPQDSQIIAQQLAEMTRIRDSWLAQRQNQLTTNQDSLYSALQIKQQQTVIIGSVLSSSLLIIVLYLVFLRKRTQYSDQLASLQQRLLRIQMNPHFLFNALSCIQHFLLKNDAASASRYLSKFSKLMRQTLELSTRETISIEEEKEMLENYLTIQQMRSQHKFDFEVTVDPELLLHEAQIPPMCAQPFVENAIEHGQISQCKNGKLTVRFQRENNHLLLLVEDNGHGLKTCKKQQSRRSLSTKITKERLSLLERKFKTRLGLIIGAVNDQQERSGTRVQIKLPLI